jgi:hypothetical protein
VTQVTAPAPPLDVEAGFILRLLELLRGDVPRLVIRRSHLETRKKPIKTSFETADAIICPCTVWYGPVTIEISGKERQYYS